MSYEEMTDFDINKMVGFLRGSIRKGKTRAYYDNRMPDYCNNPSDAWPIIIGNGISIVYDDQRKTYFVHAGVMDTSYQNANPLRSAMIVYLRMNEGNGD